jgi:protein O-mannosyl-transferase
MNKKNIILIVLFLIIASCAAFGRITGNDFINFDDDYYITENSHIQSGINAGSIKWAFVSIAVSNWHPLTWISHMLDWRLFGANASGHHFVNLLLHIGAVIFLFLFLNKTTTNIWPAAFAAAFFALHPLRVESVAWVSERKDVLSMFFGMACLYIYAFYAGHSKLSRYLLCLILFALALMSKPMLVSLPFVLMLLDYWPLGRWQKALSVSMESRYQLAFRLLWEKVPFLLLTITSIVLTLWAQAKGNSIISIERLNFSERLSNAIVSYMAYLGKIFWPADLVVFYPYEVALPLWKVLISAFTLMATTIVALSYIRKLPFLFVGWFWYLGTLIPVIGLVQVGKQSMADRYTYLPSIGIAVILAWLTPYLFRKAEIHEKLLFSTAITVLCLLGFLTWMQCGYWKNSATLFSHAIRMTKDNYLAHNNLGVAQSAKGMIEEAIGNFDEAIRIRPDYTDAYYNRGIDYHILGRYRRAVEDYNKAILIKPDYTAAYYNRGIAYNNLGYYQRAIEDYEKAIRIKPDYAEAYNNCGAVYLLQGNKNLGCRYAQKACALGVCKVLEKAKSDGNCR